MSVPPCPTFIRVVGPPFVYSCILCENGLFDFVCFVAKKKGEVRKTFELTEFWHGVPLPRDTSVPTCGVAHYVLYKHGRKKSIQ